MAFARDNGCNTMILTGDGEPLMNPNFLENVATWNKELDKPFRNIDVQTSGIRLTDENLRWLRNTIGVTTIALSVSSIWDDDDNAEYNGAPDKFKVNIAKVCQEIKKYDFNLRLSLNLTDKYNWTNEGNSTFMIFNKAKELGANQITFRVLYESPNAIGKEKVINDWIRKHRALPLVELMIEKYIKENGKPLEKLPFGAIRYSCDNMSVVTDSDCMSTETKEELKYLILRPNCKLYSKWDDLGSIIF